MIIEADPVRYADGYRMWVSFNGRFATRQRLAHSCFRTERRRTAAKPVCLTDQFARITPIGDRAENPGNTPAVLTSGNRAAITSLNTPR